MTEKKRPRFTGIKLYTDPQGLFKFRYPTGWHVYDLTDGRNGVLLSPDSTNPQTFVMAWKDKLDISVTADDLDVLRQGLDEGLAQLPDNRIESRDEKILDHMIRLERVHTYQSGESMVKRKLMVLYAGNYQVSMSFQGADVPAYEYWLSMGNYCMLTFDPSDVLFFVSDRDLSKMAGQAPAAGEGDRPSTS